MYNSQIAVNTDLYFSLFLNFLFISAGSSDVVLRLKNLYFSQHCYFLNQIRKAFLLFFDPVFVSKSCIEKLDKNNVPLYICKLTR